jgi:hypothetical protein
MIMDSMIIPESFNVSIKLLSTQLAIEDSNRRTAIEATLDLPGSA